MPIQPDKKIRIGDYIYDGDFVAGEDISANDAVAINLLSGADKYKIYKASAANFDKRFAFVGFAHATVTSGNPVTFSSQPIKEVGVSGLTADTDYYLSDTQGALSTTAGTYERFVGYAASSSRLVVPPGRVIAGVFKLSSSVTAPCDGVATLYIDNSSDDSAQFGSLSVNDINQTVSVAVSADTTLTVTDDVGGKPEIVIFSAFI